MATIYGELQRDIEVNTRKAAAKKALHQFKNERIKHVHAVLEHANKCTQWLREFQVYLDNEKQDRIEQYYNQIVRRFRELGYEEQDIQAIRSKSEAMCDRAVTEQVWKQIRPVLQTRVEMARCKRLDKDEEAIITSRKALVRNAYDAYKLTLRPLERLHTPVPELIYAIPAFRALIYMNLDALLKQAACNEAAQRLPEYLSAFNDQLKCCLLQSMLDHGAFDRGARRAKQLPKNADARLSLATTVFKQVIPRKLDRTFFSYNGVVLGMKMLDIWKLSCQADFWVAMYETQGREMEQPTLSYDAHASAAAKTFVVQLGLDPAITRSDDMDDLNGRFVCQHCKHREFLGILRDKAYSWRAAVEHHIIAHTRSNLPMFFKTLNEDEVKIVRRIEDGLRLQVWTCNHCPSYNVPATFYDIQEHLTTTHAISKPEENSDYFHAFPAFRYDPPPQSFSRCLQLAAAVDPAEDE
ncbi:hypothetical protein EVJ58_g6535 [Rhodofomes roseus]|uniref:Uncharacterized protein n=1 Tax=Rhodofomes roseus TaxID=34475 RepID=A0A4Y9YBK2_9APHY|nr:hypothetical protein EVJ58_g6535 [Rhodofomes roseus]